MALRMWVRVICLRVSAGAGIPGRRRVRCSDAGMRMNEEDAARGSATKAMCGDAVASSTPRRDAAMRCVLRAGMQKKGRERRGDVCMRII
ncbi:hypothetical protein B0H13DRAFT_435674 [Mycena leptocephala]|nr:hypothetical protein B0H13DRAFT_435674 [Mycena leptocephala]